MKNTDIARVFKAFGDENRIEIIELLKKGEMCGNDILKKVDVVQSTLSHHMKILCESGIVNARKSGKMTYYSVSNDGIDTAAALLEAYRIDGAQMRAQVKPEKITEKTKADTVKTAPAATTEAEDDDWTKMVTFID